MKKLTLLAVAIVLMASGCATPHWSVGPVFQLGLHQQVRVVNGLVYQVRVSGQLGEAVISGGGEARIWANPGERLVAQVFNNRGEVIGKTGIDVRTHSHHIEHRWDIDAFDPLSYK